MNITYKLVNNNKFEPFQATKYAAGFDLPIPYDYIIEAGEKKLISLDICFMMPDHCVGFLTSRSSATLLGQITSLGIIDSDYRGSISALIHNTTDKAFQITAGQRLVQIIFLQQQPISLKEDSDKHSLVSTRGENGFGSSGFFSSESGSGFYNTLAYTSNPQAVILKSLLKKSIKNLKNDNNQNGYDLISSDEE